MLDKISIVFLGSGPVALESVKHLAPRFQIEAIITKPSTLNDMQAALPYIQCYEVSDKQDLEKLITNNSFQSRIAILVDFGIIVTQHVIDTFPLGIINSHFSLLPEWRGADPITFTVLSGQTQTGVSLMLLSEKLDEGPLLAQAAYTVPEGITTPVLTTALIEISNALLDDILPRYVVGACVPVPQLEATIVKTATPTYSRKLTKEDGTINWSKPALQLEREIRAFVTWPKSRTTLAGKEVIVTAAKVIQSQGIPGHINPNSNRLIIGCGQDSLEIERLKPAGKPDMAASAFLAGYKHRL